MSEVNNAQKTDLGFVFHYNGILVLRAINII